MISDNMVGIFADFVLRLGASPVAPNSQLARPASSLSRSITGLVSDSSGKTIWPRSKWPRLTLTLIRSALNMIGLSAQDGFLIVIPLISRLGVQESKWK